MPKYIDLELEGSIDKWKRVLNGSDIEKGAINCPLCQKYLRGIGSCLGCVVHQKTGKPSCYSTPYEQWERHQGIAHDQYINRSVQCPECKEIAQAEIDFLLSLRA